MNNVKPYVVRSNIMKKIHNQNPWKKIMAKIHQIDTSNAEYYAGQDINLLCISSSLFWIRTKMNNVKPYEVRSNIMKKITTKIHQIDTANAEHYAWHDINFKFVGKFSFTRHYYFQYWTNIMHLIILHSYEDAQYYAYINFKFVGKFSCTRHYYL